MKKIIALLFATVLSSIAIAQSSFKTSGNFIIKANQKGFVDFSGATIECDTLIIDKNVTQIKLKDDLQIICNEVHCDGCDKQIIITVLGKAFELIIDTKSGKLDNKLVFIIREGETTKFTLTSH